MVVVSDRGRQMARYVPVAVYGRSGLGEGIREGTGGEFDLVRAALAWVLDQFYVATATGTGLDLWEANEGFVPSPDKPEQERRERLLAHIRSSGTATLPKLKRIAESFENGAVHVIEDFEDDRVVYSFAATGGAPANADDVEAALRRATPAALAVDMQFNFTTWNDLSAQNWTWNQLSGVDAGGPVGAPLTWDQLGVLL